MESPHQNKHFQAGMIREEVIKERRWFKCFEACRAFQLSNFMALNYTSAFNNSPSASASSKKWSLSRESNLSQKCYSHYLKHLTGPSQVLELESDIGFEKTFKSFLLVGVDLGPELKTLGFVEKKCAVHVTRVY